MSPSFHDLLARHEQLSARRSYAQAKLVEVQTRFANDSKIKTFSDNDVTVFVAGSLARDEAGALSDLDLFLLTKTPENERSHLQDIEILATAVDINRELEYEPFSNDGEYLKLHSLDHMLSALGAPQDDSENIFTTRMLLLLESRCVFNVPVYEGVINEILAHYFRDNRGKATFRPLFLLNDILRYWRTLCLNYELTRDDPDKPWRKKNINLKFSRMLTIFGTVLPLVATEVSDAGGVKALAKHTPHERLALGLDALDDEELRDKYGAFLDDYQSFLSWKEDMGSAQELSNDQLDKESRAAFSRFADFLHRALTHDKIAPELRRFLIL